MVTSSAESPSPDRALSAPPLELRLATIEEDETLLGPWAKAFEALCGERVALEPLDPARPDAGRRMTFPRVFQPPELIGSTGHFRQSHAMVEQVRRMGFDWDEADRLMTVPAPGAFNARVATMGLPHAGFSLAYTNATTPAMPLGPWLLRYMHGAITVLVNAPAFYQSLLSGDAPHLREGARWGLMSLAHDLSVHALNYHLVPHGAVADLASRIREALPERYAAWSEPGAITPLTLTYFYDNDFNRYTYAVWCRCERPEDFEGIFAAKRNYDQLLEALEIRLEETKAGIGDVPSGDFDDMAPLAQTEFEIRR